MTLVVGCRVRPQDASVALGDLAAPNPAFAKLCSGQPVAPADRELFRMFVGHAYAVTTTDVLGTSSSDANATEILATHSCEQIWQRFNDFPSFNSFAFITSYRSFAALQGIKNLELNLVVGNLPPGVEALKGLNVKKFRIGNAPNMAADLGASAQKVVEAIASYENLVDLEIDTIVLGSLTELAGLSHIERASFAGNGLTNLDFLRTWRKLKHLELYKNPIRDLEALKDLLELTKLGVENSLVESIDPLMLLGNLQELNMNDNPPLANILALQYLPNLRDLKLTSAGIVNIDALANLPLEILNLDGNPIESIEALAQSTIGELTLSGTKLRDLTPINTMTHLVKLNIDRTPVRVMPILPKTHPLATLSAVDTNITDKCPIYRHPAMMRVRLSSMSSWRRPNGIPVHCQGSHD